MSETVGTCCEFEENAWFNFDVEIRLPLAGFVVRYRGFLDVQDSPA